MYYVRAHSRFAQSLKTFLFWQWDKSPVLTSLAAH